MTASIQLEAGFRPHNGPQDLLPLALFLLLAALFTVLGLFLLRRPRRAAALFADRDARRAFRPRDARAVGIVFAVAGGVLLAIGAVRLVVILALG